MRDKGLVYRLFEDQAVLLPAADWLRAPRLWLDILHFTQSQVEHAAVM